MTSSVLVDYGRVINALCLHDIKTRFFGNGLGQVVMVLWPFVHIICLLAIYIFSARTVPYGDSLVLYSSVGVLPVINFMYPSRWILFSVVQNKCFTQYPKITTLDLMISRSILEVITMTSVTLMLILILTLLGENVSPANYSDAAAAWASSLLLAVCVGILNGAIATIMPLWGTIYTLLTILLYASSGVLFVPSSLPAPAREVLSWNPVLQAVEWMRSAYYSDFNSIVLDRGYVVRFAIFCLATGLILERFTRRLRGA